MGWRKKESAGLDSWPTCSEPEAVQFIWVCCLSANCLMIPIFANVTWWSIHELPFFQFKWLSVCHNIEEYVPVLVIGSYGPPKPKQNNYQEVLLSIFICMEVPNSFLMNLNAKKCKEPWVCFLKWHLATPFTNWSTSTRNSLFTKGSSSGYPGKSEIAWAHLYDCIQG